jgi:hypothetical protein
VVLDGLEEPARKPIDSLAWSVQREDSIKIDEAERKTKLDRPSFWWSNGTVYGTRVESYSVQRPRP